MLVSASTVVLGDIVARPGWLDSRDGYIVAAGAGAPPVPADLALGDPLVPGVTLVPGFVDMHAHGGGGADYAAPDPDEVLRAVAYHRRHGTTTSIASLVSAEPDELAGSIRVLAGLVDAGEVAGIHLEGPWLSPARAGAHDPARLRHPDPATLARLLDLAAGRIRMVTLAPELPGGLAAVGQVVAAGAVAAIGHTDADHDTTRAALRAGASVATHLFNAMPPVHHRRPGPVPALLTDPRVTVELVADGVHLDPALVTMVCRAVGYHRVALVTDAIAASGQPDGWYRLGGLPVVLAGGEARVPATGALAGGTATMDQLFRTALGDGYPDPAALRRAVAVTAGNPARALGLTRVGRLAVGYHADAVALDHRYRVRGVLRRGRWLPSD